MIPAPIYVVAIANASTARFLVRWRSDGRLICQNMIIADKQNADWIWKWIGIFIENRINSTLIYISSIIWSHFISFHNIFWKHLTIILLFAPKTIGYAYLCMRKLTIMNIYSNWTSIYLKQINNLFRSHYNLNTYHWHLTCGEILHRLVHEHVPTTSIGSVVDKRHNRQSACSSHHLIFFYRHSQTILFQASM